MFGSSRANAASSSATTSCSSADSLRVTTNPLPNSFNFLTTAVISGFIIAGIQEYPVYPFPVGANASLLWDQSIIDWVSHNSNYTQWTFNVTPNMKWSNGQNITAQDILNTYSASYGLNSSYDFVGLHTEIVSSSMPNSSEAVFNLNKTDAHLPEEMSSLIYTTVEPQSAIAQGPGADLFGSDVADGPFYVANYTSGSSSLVMPRNQYFNPLPGPCALDVNFAETTTQSSAFLLAGKTDFAGPLDPSNAQAVTTNPNIHLLDEKGNLITTLEYNITSYPYNMTAFRQAMAYAMNYSTFVQQGLAGYGVPGGVSEGTLPQTSSLYDASQAKYSYNVTEALNLLHSIGFTTAGDGSLHYANGTAVSTTIWTDNELSWDTVIGGLVQGYLQALGMQVALQVVSPSTITGDYASNLFGIRDSLIIWTSSGTTFGDAWLDAQPGWNVYLRPGYANSHWEYPANIDAQYQSNLTAIDSTANVSLQRTLLTNIQQLNAANLPVITLDYPDNLYAYNSQHWTNWCSTCEFENGNYFNGTMFATLSPVGSSNSTTTTTAASSSSSSSGASSASSSAATTTSATTTSPVSSSTNNTLYLIAGIVVVIIVVGAIVGFVLRRR